MTTPTTQTFIVERNTGNGVKETKVTAERGDQANDSTRVTFYTGTSVVASFINVQGWYPQESD